MMTSELFHEKAEEISNQLFYIERLKDVIEEGLSRKGCFNPIISPEQLQITINKGEEYLAELKKCMEEFESEDD